MKTNCPIQKQNNKINVCLVFGGRYSTVSEYVYSIRESRSSPTTSPSPSADMHRHRRTSYVTVEQSTCFNPSSRCAVTLGLGAMCQRLLHGDMGRRCTFQLLLWLLRWLLGSRPRRIRIRQQHRGWSRRTTGHRHSRLDRWHLRVWLYLCLWWQHHHHHRLLLLRLWRSGNSSSSTGCLWCSVEGIGTPRRWWRLRLLHHGGHHIRWKHIGWHHHHHHWLLQRERQKKEVPIG